MIIDCNDFRFDLENLKKCKLGEVHAAENKSEFGFESSLRLKHTRLRIAVAKNRRALKTHIFAKNFVEPTTNVTCFREVL